MAKSNTITKRYKDEIYAWDPGAHLGKGYWFVLGTKGGLGRPATKVESVHLGRPDPGFVDPKTPKVLDNEKNTKEPKKAKGVPKDGEPRIKGKGGKDVSPYENIEGTYQHAFATKKKSLMDMVRQRIVDGGGVKESVKGAISEKSKAFAKRVKNQFDFMNVAKMFGGKTGAALYGRAAGRKQEDIEHYSETRPTARKVEPMPRDETETTPGGKAERGTGGKLASILTGIHDLIASHNEEEKKTAELDRGFKREREKEKLDMYNKLLAAITGRKVGTGTVTPEGGGGLFSWLQSIIDGLLLTLAPLLTFAKFLGTGAMTALKMLGGFLLSPWGAALLATASAGALLFLLSDALRDFIKNNMPNLKTGMTPKEAAALLENGDIRDIEAAGGKEHLEGIVKGGVKRAEDILKRGDQKEILAAGGKSVLEKTIIEGINGDIPMPTTRRSDEPDTPIPRPERKGLAQGRWDSMWAGKRDPITGKLLTTTSATPATDVPGVNPPIPTASPETATPATDAPGANPTGSLGARVQAATNENVDLQSAWNQSSQPIMMNNSSTRGVPGTSETGVVGKVRVRNDDDTILRALRQSIRTI